MPTPITLLEFFGASSGVGLAMLLNLSQRKPMNTGLYKHAALAAVGYFCGQSAETYYKRKERETLLILEDYVRRHPEDFPDEGPKTYGDVLLKWYPVR
ncbi:NADH dehydrogenase [ubiquinone] 1 subunit C2-like [Littorina saxatilis]|uniref:NADH dehydrogenase [ubiquinone] 1 subunit C2 n=1 Tax=Littorina saxatilis TaxID=31220 RepID=A0AAN9B161_9CAEN